MLASGPRACIAASPVSSDTVSGRSCQSYQLRLVTAPRGCSSPNVLTMRSTEAPVRSRACSSNLRAWVSSTSLSGTGSGDTGHQRKAAGPRIRGLTVAHHGHTLCGRNAHKRPHHTIVMPCDRSCARIRTLARASKEYEKPGRLQGFYGVARPGLEPGTPRFSAARPPRANVLELQG